MPQSRKLSSRFLSVVLVFVLVLVTVAPANAWNATGHRIIAAIAYDRLTPAARARVDRLIQAHPDYSSIFAAGAPEDPVQRARAAFLTASTWPDVIRGDARFYDETRADAVPTPLLPGFPNMGRHVTWHYYDIPYAPDGAKPTLQLPPHALSELRRILNTIAEVPDDEAAYDLPWLEHLVGDVHQPLHATSRFLKAQPKGDAGGNFVFVKSANSPATNLHAYWDGAAGSDSSAAFVDKFAASVTSEFPQSPYQSNQLSNYLSTNPKRWLKESFRLDKSDVYSFGLVTGTKEHPIALSADYDRRAQAISRRRLAMAGYRLAAVLNARLK